MIDPQTGETYIEKGKVLYFLLAKKPLAFDWINRIRRRSAPLLLKVLYSTSYIFVFDVS